MLETDGFDCLGATDTSDSFSDFLKKEGINLMSKTAEQLGKDGKPAPKPEDKKKKTSGSGSLAYPLVGAAGGVIGGAVVWKAHRIWGGLLGGATGGILGRLVSMFV